MFTLHQVVKLSVTETDPLQCEQEQELPCVAGIKHFYRIRERGGVQGVQGVQGAANVPMLEIFVNVCKEVFNLENVSLLGCFTLFLPLWLLST